MRHLRRLLTGLPIAAVAALPESLVRTGDAQTGFQTWLVIQLLGVIVAAIAVAAMFSVVGLGLVRVATLPWRHTASTFVAWSFLRAPLVRAPWPVRGWRWLLAQVDAVPDAPRHGWRAWLETLGLVGLAGAGLWYGLMLGDGGWLPVFARNLSIWLVFHTLLLACALLPWPRARPWPVAVLGVAAVIGGALAARLPVVTARLEPVALVTGFALAFAVAAWRIGDEIGRSARLQRRGLVVFALALAALSGGVLLPTSPVAVALLTLGVALGIAAAYLVLQGQAKVSVPVFVSIVGVAAGVWALIVVLSVMGGFAHDLRQKMLVANAHALIERPGRVHPLVNVAPLAAKLRQLPGVEALSPQVRGDAILSSAFNVNNFVAIRGVDPHLPEVRRELGGTLVTGGLALLDVPAGMGADRALGRKGAAEPDDLPPVRTAGEVTPTAAAPTTTESDGATTHDMDALFRLAPGPAEPPPPQETRPVTIDPRALMMPPDSGAVRMLGSGSHGPLPRATEPPASASTLGGIAPPPAFADPDAAPLVPLVQDLPVAPGILLGTELARSLQVELGDRVEVVTPDGDIGPTGLRPRVRTFRVAGTFETGLYEADSKVAYITLPEAVRYFNLEGDANVLELRLHDPEEPDAVMAAVRETLKSSGQPADTETIDWRELNRSLFSALAFERLVVFLVLTLIILVAGFSIVSALTMVILQKRDGISMLRAMGATATTIRSAFVQMGGAIGLIGTTAGAILGLGTCFLIERLGIQLPEAYYVRTLPVRVQPAEIAIVVLAAVALSLVATVFPATSAARFTPLEGLRHG